MPTAPTYDLMTFGGQRFYMSNGTTSVRGTGGPIYNYRVGIQKVGLGLSMPYVADFIDYVLGHTRYGWTKNGRVRFRRVEDNPGTFILIALPDTVDTLCYPLETKGEVSCRNGRNVILNVERWRHGVPHYESAGIVNYRKMLINHEMGHRIGQKHRTCPGSGQRAPVMQQQTYGMQGCALNWWPLDVEVASLPIPDAASLMNLAVEEEAVLE